MSGSTGISNTAAIGTGLVLGLLVAIAISLFGQGPTPPHQNDYYQPHQPGADETDPVVTNGQLDAANRWREWQRNRNQNRAGNYDGVEGTQYRSRTDHSRDTRGSYPDPPSPYIPPETGAADPEPRRLPPVTVEPGPTYEDVFDFDRFSDRRLSEDLLNTMLLRKSAEDLAKYRDLRLIGGAARLDLARSTYLKATSSPSERLDALRALIAAPGSAHAKMMLDIIVGEGQGHELAWMYFATRPTPLTDELGAHLSRLSIRDMPELRVLLAIVVNHPDRDTWEVLLEYGQGQLDGQYSQPDVQYPAGIVSAVAWGTGARFTEDDLAGSANDVQRAISRRTRRSAFGGLRSVREPDNTLIASRSLRNSLSVSRALDTHHGVLPELSFVQILPPSTDFRSALRLIRQQDSGDDTPGVRRLWREGLGAIRPCLSYARDHPVEAPPGDRVRREPADTSHPGIDDILFVTTMRYPEIADEIEQIAVGAMSVRLDDIRAEDPLRVRRLELARRACLRYFTSVGAVPGHNGREFLSQVLRNMAEFATMETQIATYRCVISLDDPHLIPAMLDVPAKYRGPFWAEAMTSLTRHTLDSDAENNDPAAWTKWLKGHVPTRRVRVTTNR